MLVKIFAFLIIFSVSIQAETIILRSGGRVSAKIINQNIDELSVKYKGEDEIKKINKDNVLKLIYKEITDAEEASIRIEEEKRFHSKKPELAIKSTEDTISKNSEGNVQSRSFSNQETNFQELFNQEFQIKSTIVNQARQKELDFRQQYLNSIIKMKELKPN